VLLLFIGHCRPGREVVGPRHGLLRMSTAHCSIARLPGNIFTHLSLPVVLDDDDCNESTTTINTEEECNDENDENQTNGNQSIKIAQQDEHNKLLQLEIVQKLQAQNILMTSPLLQLPFSTLMQILDPLLTYGMFVVLTLDYHRMSACCQHVCAAGCIVLKKLSVLNVITLRLLRTKKTHTGALFTGLPRGWRSSFC